MQLNWEVNQHINQTQPKSKGKFSAFRCHIEYMWVWLLEYPSPTPVSK